jgi:hypothetical protein
VPLRRMKGQRRELELGDVFVFHLDQDDSYRFGRIVKMGETTPEARFPGDALVYLYAPAFAEPKPDYELLTPDSLLMAPEFVIKWMWTKGYFHTVDHRPLEPGDLLTQHCFYSAHYEGYVDENDRRLDRRYEPCGRFSLPIFEWLEEQIDAAVAGTPIPAPYPD